eukprot:g1512.t1
MNKLPEIRLPTFHGKEWAAVAITAVLAVFSTIYVALKPSASTAGRIENGSKETYEEEEYDHVYTNRSEETSDELLKWLGTRKSFHEVLRQHPDGPSPSSLKVKLQQNVAANSNNVADQNSGTASNNEGHKFQYQKLSTHYYSPGTIKVEAKRCENNVSTLTEEPRDGVPFHKKVYYGNPMNAAYTPSTTTQLSGEYNSLNVDPDIYIKLEDVSPRAWCMQMTPTPLKLNHLRHEAVNSQSDIATGTKDADSCADNYNTPTSRNIEFSMEETYSPGVNTPTKKTEECSVQKAQTQTPSSSPSSSIDLRARPRKALSERVANMSINRPTPRSNRPLFSPSKANPLPYKTNEQVILKTEQKRDAKYTESCFKTPVKQNSRITLQRKKVPNVNYNMPTPNQLR